MSVNKVILMGHTGKAPDFREFDNGGCVATFSLGTTKRGYTTKDGRQIPERTEWHNVVLQNGLAKVANQHVKKGDKLYIEGELSFNPRTYIRYDCWDLEANVASAFVSIHVPI